MNICDYRCSIDNIGVIFGLFFDETLPFIYFVVKFDRNKDDIKMDMSIIICLLYDKGNYYEMKVEVHTNYQ